MMIVTDTASDILEEEALSLGVELVPLDILFGNERFDRNTSDSFERFYTMLAERDDFPTTSQPSPSRYEKLFSRAASDGEDVLVIALSGRLSGTVESARLAAAQSEWSDRIVVFDSRHAIASQRILVERAVAMRNAGATMAEIIHDLESLASRIRICGVLDSLEYLRRGGRIPAALAVVGSVLNIKPVIAVDDGGLECIGKTHGRHAGQKFVRREFEKRSWDASTSICFLYSQGTSLVREFAADFCDRYGIDEASVRFVQIGPVIGAHLGPDCVGLAFVMEE